MGIGASATAKDLVKRREMAAAVRMAQKGDDVGGRSILTARTPFACEKPTDELY